MWLAALYEGLGTVCILQCDALVRMGGQALSVSCFPHVRAFVEMNGDYSSRQGVKLLSRDKGLRLAPQLQLHPIFEPFGAINFHASNIYEATNGLFPICPWRFAFSSSSRLRREEGIRDQSFGTWRFKSCLGASKLTV